MTSNKTQIKSTNKNTHKRPLTNTQTASGGTKSIKQNTLQPLSHRARHMMIKFRSIVQRLAFGSEVSGPLFGSKKDGGQIFGVLFGRDRC